MGGSAAEAPTSPDTPSGQLAVPRSDSPPSRAPLPGVRASDAEREEIVGELREQFAAGRLSRDTFLFRMNAAMEARHVGELPPLLDGLPSAASRPAGVLDKIKTVWGLWTGRQARLQVSRLGGGRHRGGPGPGGSGSSGTGSGGSGSGGTGSGRAGSGGAGPARPPTGEMHLPAAEETPPASSGPLRLLPFPPAGTGNAEGFFTIGRDSRCDLAIDDMTVSRIHARLERMPEGWLLKDLSSTNGTRLNGWRVRGQVAVRAGDVVRFGDVEYTLTDEAPGTLDA